MLIELLTPLLLATAPVRINVPQGSYNHQTQVSSYSDGLTGNGITYNGTQTFDFRGRPNDSDND